MSFHHFYKDLEQRARTLFPSLTELPQEGDTQIAWDHLISPLEIKLPKSVLARAQAAISAFYKLSRRASYQASLPTAEDISATHTAHRSVLMAYDFHTNEQGECSLVEINTNASGFLLASLMEMCHQASDPPSKKLAETQFAPLEKLRASFESDLSAWQSLTGNQYSAPAVAIVDEDVLQQRMYLEFLMYRDLLNSWGWKAELHEADGFTTTDKQLLSSSGKPVEFVYNRLTDFYLQDPAYASLRSAFVKNLACLSPNPREYWLLSDKQRLVQMSDARFLEQAGASQSEMDAIRAVLIPTFEKKDFPSEEEIWTKRKNLFFKPKQSYGGKSVYRGESVSRKVFERLMQEDILIQNFTPAQKVPHEDPRSVLNNWKFDLRFFVYEDQIQLVSARIYQGQVTNFSSPLGGFTLVRFV